MVERILDACARILSVSGYDGVSTYRIATEADISPGSLYQYFPNKDAIIAAAVERMIESVAGELATAFTEMPRDGGQEQVRFVVTAVLDATERNRELTRVLVEQMPRLGGSAEIRSIEQRAVDTAVGYRAALRGAMPFAQRPAMEWMAIQALQQITARYVLDRPSITRADFIDELTRLLITFAALSLS
jgi:AcrR family transcriptional regulator